MSTMDVPLPGKTREARSRQAGRAAAWRGGAWLGIVSIVLYFALWFAITEQGFNLVRPIKFPSPLMVVQAALRTADLIPIDIFATVSRVLFGFSAGTLLGLGLGLAM